MAAAGRGKIWALAAKADMCMSDYVTAGCLGKRIVVIDEQKELLRQLKGSGGNINRLTVLANMGTVQVIGCVDGEDRYDGNTALHGHFICRSCGAVIDLPPIPVEPPDMSEVGEPDSYGVTFYGRCSGCLAQQKTS